MPRWRRRKADGWLRPPALTMAAAVTAVGAALAPPASAAATGQPATATGQLSAWKIEKSPNATVPRGQFNSVSCSSAHACTAVGAVPSIFGGTAATLAERWDGKSWHSQPTPNPIDNTVPVQQPTLLGLSCPTSDFCEAVGVYQVGLAGLILAERWNGRTWRRQFVPAPAGSTTSFLRQVSCTSATFCEAVGTYENGAGRRLSFAARWNGSSWSLQFVPDPVASTISGVGGVSCVTPRFCEATGGSDADGFAVRWNGVSWHFQKVPAATDVGPVSCVSVTFCETVGLGAGAMWNGSSWSAQTIPAPSGATSVSLGGLSCPTTKFCEAVGQFGASSGRDFSLAATWNGTSWAPQKTPNPADGTFTSLTGVSCPTTTMCEAGGESEPGTPSFVAIAESWNGSSWRMQHPVNPPGQASNVLSAVSCTSAVFCEAVGSHPDIGGASVALAEEWNGTTWTIQKTPSPAPASGSLRMILSGVSCASRRFCVAVGARSSPVGGGAEVWNGASWALAAIPGGDLTSVSCTSARFCMAAGDDGHVDIWNGITWSAEPTASGFSALTSVSCSSSSSCEAVGFGPTGDDAEGWNGTTWSPQATPTPPGGSGPALKAISCTGPKSCEAVGSYSGNPFQAPLAEVWNGTAWKVQHTPNPAGSFGTSLLGVSCTASNSCAAVGQYDVSVSILTFAMVWNGTTWSRRSTPNIPFAGQDTLNGVSCVAGHPCTAVGVTDTATLIETGD